MSDKRVTRNQSKNDPELQKEIDKFKQFRQVENEDLGNESELSDTFNSATSHNSTLNTDIFDETENNTTGEKTVIDQVTLDDSTNSVEDEDNMSTAGTNISLKDALKVVPEFGGDLSELSNFLEGCQEAKEMIPTTAEENLTKVLRGKLVGEARKAILGEKFKKVDELTNYIRDIYLPAKTVHQLQGELGSSYQKENESVIVFANRMRDLGTRILEAKRVATNAEVTDEFKKSTTDNIIECFKNGLKPEIERKMIVADTVLDIVKNAITAERLLNAQNALRGINQTGSSKLVEKKRVYFCKICRNNEHDTQNCSKKGNDICSICNRVGHPTSKCTFGNNSNEACQLCGVAGHQAKQCTGRKLNIVCQICGIRGHGANTCRTVRNGIQCQLCGITGHKANTCSRLNNQSRILNQEQMVNRSKLHCEKCNRNGHTAARCYAKTVAYTSNENSSNQFVCFYCKQPGHFIRECPVRESENSRVLQNTGASPKNQSQEQRQMENLPNLSELIPM